PPVGELAFPAGQIIQRHDPARRLGGGVRSVLGPLLCLPGYRMEHQGQHEGGTHQPREDLAVDHEKLLAFGKFGATPPGTFRTAVEGGETPWRIALAYVCTFRRAF